MVNISSIEEILKRLGKTDGFYIEQQWGALEEITSCWEQENVYEVYSLPRNYKDRKAGNITGAFKFFSAKEKTGCCKRNCCGENRPFTFNFLDVESKKPVIQISRKLACCGWAVIPCCAHQVDVHALVKRKKDGGHDFVKRPNKKTLAARVQTPKCTGGCCCPTYYLLDHKKRYMGRIEGYTCWALPCFICDTCGADFQVYDHQNIQVAKIDKLGIVDCKDILYEIATSSDKYTVEFDKGARLGPNFKLATLAAVMQIDFNFFEDERGLQQCHCCDLYCCGYALPCIPLCCMSPICFLCCCCCCDKKKNKTRRNSRLLTNGDRRPSGAPQMLTMEV
eukprot:maker-scaffold_24-snap-gene-4.35-mRNA-1 protein AED:0.04 eAED:0.04 QI:90/1/1/1/1/1/5/68/335